MVGWISLFCGKKFGYIKRVFQKAVKVVYAIEDGKEIKPEMKYEEYEVGDKPEKFQFKIILFVVN